MEIMKMIKKGFTLAEILITMFIIGVVLVFVIGPTILTLSKKDVPGKLRKVQNTFSQVSISLVAENGAFNTWDWGGSQNPAAAKTLMEGMFKPKLSLAKYCGLEINKGCAVTYAMLDGTMGINPDNIEWATKAIMNDGMSIAFETTSQCSQSAREACGTLTVDINGPGKPNKVGKDVFFFVFYSDGNFLPLGYYERKEDIEQSCSKTGDGKYCAAKIALDGWDTREDEPYAYPW